MELLIVLIVFVVGLMIFVALLYGAAKLLSNRKMRSKELVGTDGYRSPKLRINKSRNIYSASDHRATLRRVID